jgi:hypothetical protein
MAPVLIVGATGRIGRLVVDELVGTDVPVRALTRQPATAELPADVEVVFGDLTEPVSLDAALRDVGAVFLVWTAAPGTAPAVIEQIASHAERLAFLSSPHQTPHPFFQQPNPMADLHANIERLIADAGIESTIVRPGMFTSNVVHWWGPSIRAGAEVRWPYGAGEGTRRRSEYVEHGGRHKRGLPDRRSPCRRVGRRQRGRIRHRPSESRSLTPPDRSSTGLTAIRAATRSRGGDRTHKRRSHVLDRSRGAGRRRGSTRPQVTTCRRDGTSPRHLTWPVRPRQLGLHRRVTRARRPGETGDGRQPCEDFVRAPRPPNASRSWDRRRTSSPPQLASAGGQASWPWSFPLLARFSRIVLIDVRPPAGVGEGPDRSYRDGRGPRLTERACFATNLTTNLRRRVQRGGTASDR